MQSSELPNDVICLIINKFNGVELFLGNKYYTAIVISRFVTITKETMFSDIVRLDRPILMKLMYSIQIKYPIRVKRDLRQLSIIPIKRSKNDEWHKYPVFEEESLDKLCLASLEYLYSIRDKVRMCSECKHPSSAIMAIGRNCIIHSPGGSILKALIKQSTEDESKLLEYVDDRNILDIINILRMIGRLDLSALVIKENPSSMNKCRIYPYNIDELRSLIEIDHDIPDHIHIWYNNTATPEDEQFLLELLQWRRNANRMRVPSWFMLPTIRLNKILTDNVAYI